MECHDVRCILTYGGDFHACIVNYCVLAYMATLCVAFFVFSHRGAAAATRCYHAGGWLLLSLLLVAYQIGLCLVVGCAGISIVWNALAGFVLGGATRLGCAKARHFELLLAPIAAVDAYYAMTAPPITTVAHLCAIALGLLCNGLRRCLEPPRPQPASHEPLIATEQR